MYASFNLDSHGVEDPHEADMTGGPRQTRRVSKTLCQETPLILSCLLGFLPVKIMTTLSNLQIEYLTFYLMKGRK